MKVNFRSLSIALGLLISAGATAQVTKQDPTNTRGWEHKHFQVNPFYLQGPPNGSADTTDYTLYQTTGETVDTVTIGSRMAYSMDGDPAIAELITAGALNPSLFKWAFTSYNGTPPIQPIDASNLLKLPIYSGFTNTVDAENYSVNRPVTDGSNTYGPYASVDTNYFWNTKQINVLFQHNLAAVACPGTGIGDIYPAATKAGTKYPGYVEIGKTYHLRINEMAVSNGDHAMCESNEASGVDGDSIASIFVVDVPMLEWASNSTQTSAVCKTTDSLSVKVDFKGYAPFTVFYKVEELDASGNPTGTAKIDSAAFDTNSLMLIPGTSFGKLGKFKVTFTNITDRFSRKSLDRIQGNVQCGTPGAGTNVKNELVVNVIEPPTTQRLRHVKNVR